MYPFSPTPNGLSKINSQAPFQTLSRFIIDRSFWIYSGEILEVYAGTKKDAKITPMLKIQNSLRLSLFINSEQIEMEINSPSNAERE